MEITMFGTKLSFDDLFERFWEEGAFLKIGKKAAKRHIRASVKTGADWEALSAASEAYKQDCRKNVWRNKMNGSTFCNNWQDWVPNLKSGAAIAAVYRTLHETAELRERAEAIVRMRQRDADMWGILALAHNCKPKCYDNAGNIICQYSSAKRPKVPTVKEVMERLSNDE